VEKFGSRLWRHKYLSVTKKIIIYEDIPRIDFQTMVDNRHPQVRIRVKFSTDIDSPEYQSETQFGVVNRPVDQYHYHPTEQWLEEPCGIYPALNWIDYSDEERGVTLINKGLPAHEIRDRELYLTLLRSVLMLSSDGETGPAIPTPDAQEFKTYNFEYSLFPHKKGWKEANSFMPAYEFNHNLIGFQLPAGTRKRVRTLPSRMSFVELKPGNLVLAALKKAEDTNEVVLRFFETKGEKTAGVLNLFKEPVSAKMVNLLEEEEGEEIQCRDGEIGLEVKPFEIVTLKLKF
jgi:alpha-mannosidase